MSAPGSVLFVCNHNRVRSPMAAALLRARLGDAVRVDSCGLSGHGEEADGFAAAVMAELGVDLLAHGAKSVAVVQDEPFDLVVSLTPEAHARTLALKKDPATVLEVWPIEDPAAEQGAREVRLEAYRRVRDVLARRIADRFGA